MAADPSVTTAAPAPGAEYAEAASDIYRSMLQIIESVEPRIAAATRKELADQRDSLKLIASENYASPAVLLTMGSWLSDKYAEGTIGHRFYAGCQNVDTVETVAAEHARELFGAPYAYVQPHSGIDANLVAYWAILATRVEAPGLAEAGVKNVNDLSEADWETLRGKLGNQRLMGMSLDAGGHLTHGFRPNISGKMFYQRSYGTDPETGLARLRRAGGRGARIQAADPGRRVLGLSAAGQFRQAARDRRRGGRDTDGRHGPLRRAGRGQGVHRRRGPGAARPRHHHHDAQVAARPARRAGAGHRGVLRRRRQGLPNGVGRAAVSRHGRQRRSRSPRRGSRRSRRTRSGSPTTPRHSPRGSCGVARGWSPAAPTTTSCCSTCSRSGSPGARPSRRCWTPASSPTATRSRPTRTAPGIPAASGSALRR